MPDQLDRLIRIEWIAQQSTFRQGTTPTIKVISPISEKEDYKTDHSSEITHFLFMQGSFDPPTISHFELLRNAINLQLSRYPDDLVKVVILLSLSHVEKQIDLFNKSIFGYRFEMLEILLEHIQNETAIASIRLGISNVARYIDLITAIQNSMPFAKNIGFIMGNDVFEKVVDQQYYQEPLEELLGRIFEAEFFVANRGKTASRDILINISEDRLSYQQYSHKIHYLSIPKDLRFLNATAVRKKIASSNYAIETSVFPKIIEFLKENRLYSGEREWKTKQILIQSCIQRALNEGITFTRTQQLITMMIKKFQKNPSLQEQLISEYTMGNMNLVSSGWTELKHKV